MMNKETINKITTEAIEQKTGQKLDYSMLPDEVKAEVNRICDESIRGNRRGLIRRYYLSVKDYFTIYYCLKFVYRYSNCEIAEIVRINHDTINHIYHGLGWNYHSDFEINESMRKEEAAQLQKRRQSVIHQIEELELSEHPLLVEMLNNPAKIKKVKKILAKEGDSSSFDSYVDFMKQVYFFYVVEGLSKDFFKMFGWNVGTVQGWLKALGIRRTPEEGQQAKIRNKSQDFTSTMIEGRKTALKAQTKDGCVLSSKNEIRFRNFLAFEICNYFPQSVYDVVVCCTNIGILDSMEIDIPVMVYNNELKRLHRFAVEYNGEPFHADDSEKMQRAADRGWVYTSILDKSEYSRNKKGNPLEERARQFCKELYERVIELKTAA